MAIRTPLGIRPMNLQAQNSPAQMRKYANSERQNEERLREYIRAYMKEHNEAPDVVPMSDAEVELVLSDTPMLPQEKEQAMVTFMRGELLFAFVEDLHIKVVPLDHPEAKEHFKKQGLA